MLEKKYGEHTEELLALYEKAYPGKSPVDLLAVDTIFRLPTMEFIKERSKTPESVTYSYQLTYEFPLLDGKIAWHCSEIPFVFHNTELAPLFNKEGETDKLEEAIFGAWISFAKTGKPVIEGIDWPACTEGDEPVMIDVYKRQDYETLMAPFSQEQMIGNSDFCFSAKDGTLLTELPEKLQNLNFSGKMGGYYFSGAGDRCV